MGTEEIKYKIIPLLKKYNIRKAGIFGSYATNSVTEKSDIDLLVELGSKMSLLDFIGIKFELEDLLGCRVDMVEYKAIKPLIKDRILQQEVRIF